MKYNPFNWALDNYVIYIDQPIGVGLSPVVGNETGTVLMANSTYEASVNVENFMAKFFVIYPELGEHPFYV